MKLSIYKISRYSIAAIWFWHGLVPKLLFASSQEVEMNEKLMPFLSERMALLGSGIAEVILGILYVTFYRERRFNYISIAFPTIATFTLIFTHSHFFTLAFNPFSINLALAVLAWINILAWKDEFE